MSVVNLEHEWLERGLTAGGFAKEIGVSPSTISRLHAGKRVSPANAKLVADFLKVRVIDLAPFAPAESGAGPATVSPWRAEADEIARAGSSEIAEQVR